MKWTTQDGKEMEVSDMDDSHAQNSINMLIKKSSPQAILEMICEANEARKQARKERKSKRRFSGLNGDMAQQFNDMQRDWLYLEDEWDDSFHEL
jgi:hypothetical protein